MIKFGALLKNDYVEAMELHSKFTEREVGEAEFVAKARQLQLKKLLLQMWNVVRGSPKDPIGTFGNCEEADNSNLDGEKLSNGVDLHIKDAATNETVKASDIQSDC